MATSEGVGRRRQGDNRYEFRLGDDDLTGKFGAEAANSYIADFDDGTAAHDSACLYADEILEIATSEKYCDPGVGASEVLTASGDSGGPQFVDGKISSITSFSMSFSVGDTSYSLSTFGEVGGYVPTYLHSDFITSAMVDAVPEPATWLQMLLGFAMLGGAFRTAPSRAVLRRG